MVLAENATYFSDFYLISIFVFVVTAIQFFGKVTAIQYQGQDKVEDCVSSTMSKLLVTICLLLPTIQ